MIKIITQIYQILHDVILNIIKLIPESKLLIIGSIYNNIKECINKIKLFLSKCKVFITQIYSNYKGINIDNDFYDDSEIQLVDTNDSSDVNKEESDDVDSTEENIEEIMEELEDLEQQSSREKERDEKLKTVGSSNKTNLNKGKQTYKDKNNKEKYKQNKKPKLNRKDFSKAFDALDDVNTYTVKTLNNKDIQIKVYVKDDLLDPELINTIDEEELLGIVSVKQNYGGLIMTAKVLGITVNITSSHVLNNVDQLQLKEYHMINPQVYCNHKVNYKPFLINEKTLTAILFDNRQKKFISLSTNIRHTFNVEIKQNNISKFITISISFVVTKNEDIIFSGGLVCIKNRLFVISSCTVLSQKLIMVIAHAFMTHLFRIKYEIEIISTIDEIDY